MKKKGLAKVFFGVDGKIHCGHCSFEHTIELYMRNHLIQEHRERLSFAFCICELCHQCYNSYFPFKYHIGKCHGIRESEDMESPMPSIKIDVTEKGLIAVQDANSRTLSLSMFATMSRMHIKSNRFTCSLSVYHVR